MRVNVDEQAITEPRIKRMARKLGRTHFEVLGRLLPVWMLCYQRRSAVVSEVDIDITADLDGFAAAMVAEEMAEPGDDGIYVRGVTERIEFLERQVQKGKKSGEVRRAKNIGSTGQGTDVQHMLNGGSNHVGTSAEQRLESGRTKSRTYSPDQAPDQALSPDHQKGPPPGSVATDGAGADSAGDATGSRQTNGDAGPSPEGVEGEKGPHSRNHAQPARNAKPPPDPPVPALTTASVLLDYLLRNHPKSKLAKCTENQRETTLLRWAHDMRLMHEMDRREYGEIQSMIHWCQRDSFWSTVILSASALRDKFDTMNAQRRRPRGTSAKGTPDPTPEEVNARRIAEHKREESERERLRAIAAGADADRVSVADALADAQRKLGISSPAAHALDVDPEPEEDEPDAD